jgi:hypothetical protein
MRKLFFVAVLILGIGSCAVHSYDKKGRYKSADFPMGNGLVRTWVDVDNEAMPESFGLIMKTSCLDGLPDITHGASQEFIIAIPDEMHRLPFTDVAINWDPLGHTPGGIYDKPHFDMHFYMISEAQRTAIPPYVSDSLKFKNVPAAQYLPANYVKAPGGEPKMGAHWVDVTSREFNTNPPQFTETFVYGTYNGDVTFLEPMITYDYLKNVLTSYTRSIPWPARVKKSGYYPHTLILEKVDDEYHVTFTNLEYREAS